MTPRAKADYAPTDLAELIAECHDLPRRVGWWTDIETGGLADRNRGELLALVHTELAEAHEAWLRDERDDKLPHRVGAEVELADALIRLADYAQGFGYRVPNEVLVPLMPLSVPIDWIDSHNAIAQITEVERKNNNAQAQVENAMTCIVSLAYRYGHDLWDALREKLAFNAERADHKLENRRASGGKKF